MKTAQDSFYWSELAELTHATQVQIFGWCACETEPKQFDNCPTKGDN